MVPANRPLGKNLIYTKNFAELRGLRWRLSLLMDRLTSMMRKQLGTIIALIPLVIWVIVAEFRFPAESRIFYVPPLDLAIYILAGQQLRDGLYDPIYSAF